MDVTPAPIKSGFATSEFWLHAITTIGGIVLTFIPANSKWQPIIGGAMALASSSHWSYMRQNIKKIAISAGVAALKAVADEVNASDTVPQTTATSVPNSPAPAPKAV